MTWQKFPITPRQLHLSSKNFSCCFCAVNLNLISTWPLDVQLHAQTLKTGETVPGTQRMGD